MVFAFAIMALSVLINFGIYQGLMLPRMRAATTILRGSLLAWGDRLALMAPPGATIASREIGTIGYRSDRRMLDLTALISPELEPHLRGIKDPVAQFVFASTDRPQYLVDRAARPRELMTTSPYAAALAPLAQAPATPIDPRHDSFYTLYQVNWSAYDSLVATGVRRH